MICDYDGPNPCDVCAYTKVEKIALDRGIAYDHVETLISLKSAALGVDDNLLDRASAYADRQDRHRIESNYDHLPDRVAFAAMLSDARRVVEEGQHNCPLDPFKVRRVDGAGDGSWDGS